MGAGGDGGTCVQAATAAGRGAGWARAAREVLHRGLHAARAVRDAGEREAHLDAGERAHQRQVVEVAEVADAEHLARELARARCRATCRSARARRGGTRRRRGRPASPPRSASSSTRAGSAQRISRPHAAHGATRRLGVPVVAREHVGQALFQQLVERRLQAVEQVRRRRVRPVALRVRLEDLVPGPVAARQLRAASTPRAPSR